MRSSSLVLALVCSLTSFAGCTCGSSHDEAPPPPPDAATDAADAVASGCDATSGALSCGGKCVDATSDPDNCGGCGHGCGGGLCCSAVCVTTATCSFGVTGVEPSNVWQNGGEFVKLSGAGFGAGMRVFVGDARAPVRVVDATHATIQVPPGPLGAADLKVVLGTATATTKEALRYVAAGLATPWQQKPMASVRGEWPGVSVLQDGRVLIAGGTTVPDMNDKALSTAEIFTRNPTGADTLTPAKSAMGSPRWRAAAVTLLSGKVLVVGGACAASNVEVACAGDPKVADLFDPATDTFSPTKSPLARARINPRATLLVDGRVLVASATDPTFEIFDPVTETFSLVTRTTLRVAGFMVRLRDGSVLFGGGTGADGKTAELLDADDPSKSTPVTGLSVQRWWSTVHVLPDGRALVIGGGVGDYSGWKPQDTIEAFDPKTKTFSTLPYKLGTGRGCHASALVRDGTILVMGGYHGDPAVTASCSVYSDTVDQIDPVAGKVTAFASLPNRNTEWNAVTLLDGSVLGVGGGACGSGTALPDLDFLPGEPKAK